MNIMNADGPGPGTSPGDAPDPSSSGSKKPAIKRRTKTGCITCRRRRIKCDEGKPRCNNCIKSKRPCDGYNQRVVFKDPLGSFQQHHHMGLMFQQDTGPPPMLVNPLAPAAARGSAGTALPGPLQYIAPRPSMQGDISPNDPYALPPHTHPSMQQPIPQHMHHQHEIPLHEQLHLIPTEQLLHASAHPMDENSSFIPLNQTDDHLEESFFQGWQQQQQHNHRPHHLHQSQQQHQHQQPESLYPRYHATDALPHSAFNAPMTASNENDIPPDTLPEWSARAGFVGDDGSAPSREYSHQPPLVESEDTERPSRYVVFQEEDAYWYSDDDASMAESDDDNASDDAVARHLDANDLGALVVGRLHNHPQDVYGTKLRTFQNFADINVLTGYIPSSTNSPLTDGQTAAIFWYFVNVTGPSISIFERRPYDPSPMFNGQPVPKARQHIWTYTFPIIALNHPALLQAILALASLQMAKLRGVPPTASMKHYHLSLRRVARNYQSTSRRVQPATLAATLLLSFYEVWNSDHDKWCKHMWGARAIFKEIPLRDMTRKIIALKRKQRQHLEAMLAKSGKAAHYTEGTVPERDIDQVDANLISRLTGLPVSYEDEDDSRFRSSSGPAPTWTVPDHYTEKDIETFELISDIFWWYCKMDVYQSILGGTPLLMEYKHWTQGAPRAPFGKIDALYGTFDHLVLLLGRVCDFASKDRARKRRAKRAEGPPGTQARSPPGFAGMVPSTGHITIPNGFTPPSRDMTPPQENQDEMDLETSTAQALQEWLEIRKTFDEFRQRLGQDFDPLGPKYELPVQCAFGTALKYRSYGIAAVWMNFYMGLIVLYRMHPKMPPYAMVAAGMSAHQTAPFANEIGRIISGLTVEDLSTMVSISTIVGTVCIESCFPLFVAAVQFQDLAQRHWTVRYLRSVVRLTGWQSATQIASGCEIGWQKAADMGRGPPYQPLADAGDGAPRAHSAGRRIVDRIRELTEEEGRAGMSQFERPHYAVGLLTMEAEFNNLHLDDNA